MHLPYFYRVIHTYISTFLRNDIILPLKKKKKRRKEVTIRRFILEPSFVNYEYFNRKLTQRLLQRKNSFQKKKRRKKEAINSVCLIVFHKLCHSFYKEISVRVWEHARLIGFIAKNSAVEFDRDRRSIRSVSNRSNSSGDAEEDRVCG